MFNRRLGSTKDFWDIFTAVGTVAAAAIALAIGVRQEQVRWEDANQRAQLVAARLIPQLTATRDALKLLTSELRRYARFKSEWPNIIPWFDKLGDLARRPELPIPTSELAALCTLPNNCAVLLARAVALIEMTDRNVASFINDFPTGGDSDTLQSDAVQIWSDWADEALKLVQATLAECEFATNRLTHLSRRDGV